MLELAIYLVLLYDFNSLLQIDIACYPRSLHIPQVSGRVIALALHISFDGTNIGQFRSGSSTYPGMPLPQQSYPSPEGSPSSKAFSVGIVPIAYYFSTSPSLEECVNEIVRAAVAAVGGISSTPCAVERRSNSTISTSKGDGVTILFTALAASSSYSGPVCTDSLGCIRAPDVRTTMTCHSNKLSASSGNSGSSGGNENCEAFDDASASIDNEEDVDAESESESKSESQDEDESTAILQLVRKICAEKRITGLLFPVRLFSISLYASSLLVNSFYTIGLQFILYY